jgi:hypothetical protein
MNRLKLENEMRKKANAIKESRLIEKCLELALEYGDEKSTSKEWANANNYFEESSLKIHVETFAMADKRLEVKYSGKKVFEAKEKGNKPIKYPNPLIRANNIEYEVLVYNCGDWEKQISNIYSHIEEKVDNKELSDLQERFGIGEK